MFGLVSNEEIILASGSIMIPKYRPLFKRWTGDPILNTFGNKPLIDVHGVPCFAELAILSALEHEGWQGRWVETYGSADNDPKFLTGWDDASIKDQHHVPIPDDHVQELFNELQQPMAAASAVAGM